MNWVKKHKLSAIEAIKFNRHSYNNLNNLCQAFYLFYNIAQDKTINPYLMKEILLCQQTEQPPFYKAKLINIINKYSNLSTLGSNSISQSYFKLVDNDKCLNYFVNIANIYINLGYQPSHFKKSMLIIILKPNKLSYNNSKTFHPIVLLNTLGKLIEKI